MTKQTPSHNTYTIDLEPVGRRALITSHETLLQAAQSVGIEMASLCGGEGWCGKCRVRLISGEATPLNEDERSAINQEEQKHGIRLACQAKPLSHIKIDILPETLTASQRLQIEGISEDVKPHDPLVSAYEIQLAPPSLTDLQADLSRLEKEFQTQGLHSFRVELPLLQELSDNLRNQNWQARYVIYNHNLIAAFKPKTALIGLAVDIGSTKIAAYLVDLESGKTLAKGGVTNPQVAYGEDVVSRIAYANQNQDGRKILQERLVERINELVAELCQQINTTPQQIVAATAVGNTIIHHLFLGLPLRQLGEAPYIPTISSSIEIPAREIGLSIAPCAQLYMPPNIAGFVGADHVAMLLAVDAISQTGKTIVALDIGTNTEISLFAPGISNPNRSGSKLTEPGRLLSCSCASGPAFEGAHIQDGMRAVPGAIEHVQFRTDKVYTHTIANQPPIGLCGSGILDAVAELYRVGILDSAGRLRKDAPSVRGGEYLLIDAKQSGHGKEVVVTRKDINEIQLAKGAIRAGVDVLLNEMNIDYTQIDDFIIAGAFGTYLDVDNAVRIGMFPPLSQERFHQVGNAAGMGAKQLLLSHSARQQSEEIARLAEYIELTTNPHFSEVYVNSLNFIKV